MGWVSALIYTAVALASSAISYGISVWTRKEPDVGEKEDPTYGWGGITSTTRLGQPKPINYGRIRSGGHNIMTYYDIKYQPTLSEINRLWVSGIYDPNIEITLKGLFGLRLDVSVAWAVCMFPVSNVTIKITVPAGGMAYGCFFNWNNENPNPLDINNWEWEFVWPALYEREYTFANFSGHTGMIMGGIVCTWDISWDDVETTGAIMPVAVPFIGLQEQADQYANILLAFGEGQIHGIDEVEINGQPISRYKEVELTVKKGSNVSGLLSWDWFLPYWYTSLRFKPIDIDTFEWTGDNPDQSGIMVFPDGTMYNVARGYHNLGSGQFAVIYWDPRESGRIKVTSNLLDWAVTSLVDGVTWMGCAYRLPFGIDTFFDTNVFVWVANQATGAHSTITNLPNLGPIQNFRDVFTTYDWNRKLDYNESILDSVMSYPWAPVEFVTQEPIVDNAVAVYETEDDVNAIAIGLKCPKGLYHMSKSGKIKRNETYFAVWWRRLNPSGSTPHGMWHPLCNVGAAVAFPLAWIYQYMSGDSISQYAGQFDLRSMFTFVISDNTNSAVYRELRIDFPKGELIDRALYPVANLFNIPEPGGRGKFQIMVTKTCPDATKASDQNELWLDYIKEIRYDDIQYVNTALLGAKIKATDQLSGSIPQITGVVHGIQVPIFRSLNADGSPVLSTSHDGTGSNIMWSNNPIYCLHDLLTNERYGMGQYVAAENIDYESFLEAAQYCDEPVFDGNQYSEGRLLLNNGSATVTGASTHFENALFDPVNCFAKNLSIQLEDGSVYGIDSFDEGFTEPGLGGIRLQKFYLDRVYAGTGGYKTYVMNNKRYTFNISIDAQSDAMDLVTNICGACGCIPYWSAGTLKLKIEKAVDRDEDDNPIPVQIFNMANILRSDDITSTFSLEFLPLKELPNFIEVTYLDEDDNWEQHAIVKYDPNMIGGVGPEMRKVSIQAIGVTRENQAQRLAKYLYLHYKYCQKVISFKVESDAIACEPGDIVEVQHDMPNWHYGGRVRSSTSISITIDEDLVKPPTETWYVRVQHYDSVSKETKFQQRAVSTIIDRSVVVSPSWDYLPSENDIYIYVKEQETSEYLKTHNLFRIASVERDEAGIFTISAMEYNDEIYDETLDINVLDPEFIPEEWEYDTDPTTDIPMDVTDLTLTQTTDLNGINVSFAIPNDNVWHHATIFKKQDDEEYEQLISLTTNRYTFPAETGKTYYIKVISYSEANIASENPPEASLYLEPPRPPDITGLKLSGYPDGSTEFHSIHFGIEWNEVSLNAVSETAEDDDDMISAPTQHDYNYHVRLECLDFNPLNILISFPPLKVSEWYQSNTFFNINVLIPHKVGRRFKVSVWARSRTSGLESLNAADFYFSNPAPDMSHVQPVLEQSTGAWGAKYWNISWDGYDEPNDLKGYKLYCDADSNVQTVIPIDVILAGKTSVRYDLLDYILSGVWIRDWVDWHMGDDIYFVVVPYDEFGDGVQSQWVSRDSQQEDENPDPNPPLAIPDAPTIGLMGVGNYGNMTEGRKADLVCVIYITANQQVDSIETYGQMGALKTQIQRIAIASGATSSMVTFTSVDVGSTYTIYARAHNPAGWSEYVTKDKYITPLATAPETPVSLVLSSGVGMIFLEWTQLDANVIVKYYEIYRNSENNSATAELLGTTPNDMPMYSCTADATLMYYWVKAVSMYDVKSAWSNSVSGAARILNIEEIPPIDIDTEIDQALETWTTDIVFSSSAYNSVTWTTGTITFRNGNSYSITGETKTITASTSLYIYFDVAASTTNFQTSTSYSAWIGDGKNLICRAVYNSDTNSRAMLNPGVISGLFTADNIAAGSIAANKIVANTITGDKIAANTITGSNIAAKTITASNIASLTITAAELASNSVTATKINVSTLSAISANCGTITSGTIQGNSGNFEINLSTGSLTVTSGDITLSSSGYLNVRNSGGLKIQNSGGTVTYMQSTADGISFISDAKIKFSDVCEFFGNATNNRMSIDAQAASQSLSIGYYGSYDWSSIWIKTDETTGVLSMYGHSIVLGSSSHTGHLSITTDETAGISYKMQARLGGSWSYKELRYDGTTGAVYAY